MKPNMAHIEQKEPVWKEAMKLHCYAVFYANDNDVIFGKLKVFVFKKYA